MLRIINTKDAPNPVGPYSQAIDTGTFIFISGQIPIHPDTRNIPDSISDQTYQVLQNIRSILESQHLNINSIIKITLFIKNILDLPRINISYEKFFYSYYYRNNNQINFPTRSCVEVSRLPKDVAIEIDAIAIRCK